MSTTIGGRSARRGWRSMGAALLAASLLGVGGLPSALGALPGEMLENGGFESGLAPWIRWGDSSCIGGTTTAWSSEGHYSYYLKDTSAWSSCGVYQQVPVSPGCAYALTATVNVIAASPGGGAQVWLRWVDDYGHDVGPFPSATVTSGTGVVVLAGTAPAGATYARAWFYIPTAHLGEAYADDFSLLGVPGLECAA